MRPARSRPKSELVGKGRGTNFEPQEAHIPGVGEIILVPDEPKLIGPMEASEEPPPSTALRGLLDYPSLSNLSGSKTWERELNEAPAECQTQKVQWTFW